MADLPSNESALAVYLVGALPDGTEATPVRSTLSGDVGTADVLVSGGANGALSVGTTPVEAKVGAARLPQRKVLTVMPTNGSIFYGYSNAVTVLTGTEIFKSQIATFAASDACSIWLIAASVRDVRVTEGA